MGNKKTTKNKPPKLSSAEQKRVDTFQTVSDNLTSQGYKRTDLVMSVMKGNLLGCLLVLPIILIPCAIFYFLHGIEPILAINESDSIWSGISLILAGISVIPLALVHEGIHGISWGLNAENHMKDIEYGFLVEKLTPYCYCRSPLTKNQYLFGSLMPMTVLGLVVCILGIIMASPALMIVGIIQLLGGAGDLLISAMLMRYKVSNNNTVLMDHPIELGLVIFEKQ